MNDPNWNEKVRESMVLAHASKVLAKTSCVPKPSLNDYDQMTFARKHYDKDTKIVHIYVLYDYLRKQTPGCGPERFVIAYDKATKRTYLRRNLRSNDDIESLP
jgi:hypothetical protein